MRSYIITSGLWEPRCSAGRSELTRHSDRVTLAQMTKDAAGAPSL